MTSPELITHVEIALEKAHRGESRLDAETLAIGGFSTAWQRHLFNGLCSEPVKAYLEVGAFRGGTCCAAACGNKNLTSVVIEDFSQPFGEEGVRDDLLKNLNAIHPKTGSLTLLEGDCWKADLREWLLFDLLFYDAHHDEQYQARALPHFFDRMNENFIVIFDDAMWDSVRKGTWTGFDRLFGKCHIDRQWSFIPPKGDDPKVHNGVDLYVCSKI